MENGVAMSEIELRLANAERLGFTITHWKTNPFDVLAIHPDDPGVEYHLWELPELATPAVPSPAGHRNLTDGAVGVVAELSEGLQ